MRVLTRLSGLILVAASFGQNPPDASKKQIAKLQMSYVSAKAALAKSPTNSALKHKFVVAADMYATAAMTATSMTPHERYPLALRLYREALKIEPANHEAKNNSDMIVAVYKQMGRPIPK